MAAPDLHHEDCCNREDEDVDADAGVDAVSVSWQPAPAHVLEQRKIRKVRRPDGKRASATPVASANLAARDQLVGTQRTNERVPLDTVFIASAPADTDDLDTLDDGIARGTNLLDLRSLSAAEERSILCHLGELRQRRAVVEHLQATASHIRRLQDAASAAGAEVASVLGLIEDGHKLLRERAPSANVRESVREVCGGPSI